MTTSSAGFGDAARAAPAVGTAARHALWLTAHPAEVFAYFSDTGGLST